MKSESKRTQTIEKTGKEWKTLMLLGSLGAIVGGGMGVAVLQGYPNLTAPAVLTFAGGLVVFIFARIGAWWYHG